MTRHSIPKEHKAKLRMRLNKVFDPFRLYGLDVFVPPAIEAVLSIMERTLEEPDKEHTTKEYNPGIYEGMNERQETTDAD